MKPRRDTQRERVYRSERETFGEPNDETTLDLGDHAAVVAYVETITKTRWWRSRYGTMPIYVEDRGGRGYRGRAHSWRSTISIPRLARRRWIVLHELAHLLAYRRHPASAAHGPEFARAYLDLLRRFMPDRFVPLLGRFRANRVRSRVAARQRQALDSIV